jgi:hypothetical protein
VHFLGRDHLARKFLQHDAAIANLVEELAITVESFLLVLERLAQDVVDRVLVRPAAARCAATDVRRAT